jgi:hypothetical protein
LTFVSGWCSQSYSTSLGGERRAKVKVTRRGLITVGALDMTWLVVGLAASKWFWDDVGRWPLAVALVLVGITTFLGVLLSGHPKAGQISIADDETRTAITITMVVLYISILGMFSVSRFDPAAGSLSRDLIDQFGTLVILVLGFYFGTSGAIQIFGMARGQRSTGDPTAQPAGGGAGGAGGGGAAGGG